LTPTPPGARARAAVRARVPPRVFWELAESISNPVAVSQAYCGSMPRLPWSRWAVGAGPARAARRQAAARGQARLSTSARAASLAQPIFDAENGYCIVPMEQGIRITTGAEFAPRDAPPTPVQFARVLPRASELFPLGDAVEAQPWIGARPCFADSRPVIGRAPGRPGLWLAYGHGHLTLGPVTGRLLADMMTGATPFCDPVLRAPCLGASRPADCKHPTGDPAVEHPRRPLGSVPASQTGAIERRGCVAAGLLTPQPWRAARA
jgi:FAD dependent oxidoreductase